MGPGLFYVLASSALLYLLLRQWRKPLAGVIPDDLLRPDRLRLASPVICSSGSDCALDRGACRQDSRAENRA